MPNAGAEIFHVLHHPFVARCLEVVGRVETVAAADQHKDGVGVRERWTSRQFTEGQAAVGQIDEDQKGMGAVRCARLTRMQRPRILTTGWSK